MASLITALAAAASAVVVSTQAVTGVAKVAPTCPYAAPPAPTGPWQKPAGTLIIKAIGLKTPIFGGHIPDLDSEASKGLMHGPALYPMYMPIPGSRRTNSWPGQGGTVGMAGHRTTRTHPFCLVGRLKMGDKAIIWMHHGSYHGVFVYKLVGRVVLPGNNWAAFAHPQKYDAHPRRRSKGVAREYLVTGACDPPHSAAFRINDIWKLVAEWG